MTGIPKGTLDHYLAEKSTLPLADTAVKIARALNVSVESLVSGKPSGIKNNKIKDSAGHLASKLSRLSEEDLKLVEMLVDRLQDSHKKQ